MTTEQFNVLLDELDGTSLQTLKDKGAKYTANSGDALHNFRIGAQTDDSTMAQTVWHYWKKHFVALMDKIQTNDWSDREDTKEKIQDSLNYLRFIWAISEEEREKLAKNNISITTEADCCDCKFRYCDEVSEPCISCKNNYPTGSERNKTFSLKFQQAVDKTLYF